MSNNFSGHILIVGNCLLRRGIASIVRDVAPRDLIAETSCFQEAQKQLASEDFSIAIFDIDLEDALKEPASFRKLRACYPHLVLVVLSRIDNSNVILRFLAAGVNGYILHSSSQSEIEWAITCIIRGSIYVPIKAIETNLDQADGYADDTEPRRLLRGLTTRQNAVLEMLLHGYSNKQIARNLNLSHHTVKIHVAAILRFFSAETRKDLGQLIRPEIKEMSVLII